MLILFWVLFLLVGAFVILLMPALWGKEIYNAYRASRTVHCPETHAPVSVRFDALRAAFTGLSGTPKLRLKDCSRWPVRADCDQNCIPEAVCSIPESAAPEVPAAPKIPHLPVLFAAAVTWVLGIAWHSEYLFRPRWMAALGLTDPQTRELAELWTPHLLTVGVCLLFAYGVAWLQNWLGTRSLFHGIEVALGLWFISGIALFMAIRSSSVGSDFVWIEGGYTLIGALIIGAIVGGAPRRLFLKEAE